MPNLTDKEKFNARSLLVVQTAFLGDLLLGVPFFRHLRKIWPHHEVILLCRKNLGDFFLKTKLVDKVVEVVKGDTSSYSSAVSLLNENSIEYIFSPHESLRTAFLSLKIKADHKVSFKKFWNSFIFDQRILKPQGWPDPLRQMSLLFPLDKELEVQVEQLALQNNFYKKDQNGKLSFIPEWCSLNLKSQLLADDFSFQRLENHLNLKWTSESKWILLFPGSVWATKMWTEEGFVNVGRDLQQKGYQVFIMGGPGEEELGKRIHRQIPNSLNLVGRTSVYESALILARSLLMIGNDSASTHLACCANTPTISVFGPTILEFGFRPWSNHSYVVEKEGLLCRPCGPHGHRKCPLGTHECMRSIDSESVFKLADLVVDGFKVSSR
ncbi:MAG: glycosyltransferase family 9 protein [Bdellovibrionota bacterium]